MDRGVLSAGIVALVLGLALAPDLAAQCNEAYSYYCNKELDDLIHAGRSTLDQKKRTEIYAKAQKLLSEDAAYLYKWGLRGVWGISNRIEYQAPADEVDRMFTTTLRKK